MDNDVDNWRVQSVTLEFVFAFPFSSTTGREVIFSSGNSLTGTSIVYNNGDVEASDHTTLARMYSCSLSHSGTRPCQ